MLCLALALLATVAPLCGVDFLADIEPKSTRPGQDTSTEQSRQALPAESALVQARASLDTARPALSRARRNDERIALALELLEEARHQRGAAQLARLERARDLALDARQGALTYRALIAIAEAFDGSDLDVLARRYLTTLRDSASQAVAAAHAEGAKADTLAAAGWWLLLAWDQPDRGWQHIEQRDPAAAAVLRHPPGHPAGLLLRADEWLERGEGLGNRGLRLAARARALIDLEDAWATLTDDERPALYRRIARLRAELPIELQRIDYDHIDPIQWEKLPGRPIAVDPNRARHDTGIRLAAGQVIRFVPHPQDRWRFEHTLRREIVEVGPEGNAQLAQFATVMDDNHAVVGGGGPQALPRGGRDGRGRIGPRQQADPHPGGQPYGALVATIDADALPQAIDRVTGLGPVWLHCNLGNSQGWAVRGTIRVKAVALDE